jgi:membrane protein
LLGIFPLPKTYLGKKKQIFYCSPMNLSKATFSLPQLDRPSNYSIIKRLVNLALVTVGIVICVNLWLAHSRQAQQWYQVQANQLGQSLSQLSAQLLRQALMDDNKSLLAEHLTYLRQDANVLAVALYNQKGQLIEEQDDKLSILARVQQENQPSLVFIQAIRAENKVIGYLRLVLDEEKVMQHHRTYQQQLFEQVEVLMALAALVGLILTRAFYTLRYRQYRQKKSLD